MTAALTEAQAMAALTDIDAEQAILNILLDDTGRNAHWQTACETIRRNVAAEDFAPARPNGEIFRVIVEVAERGGPPDFAAIVSQLGQDTRDYAASLIGGVFLPSYGGPMASHAAFYAARVRDLAVKRRALVALGQAAAVFYDPATSAQQALSEARELLDMATKGVTADSGIYDIGDIYADIDDLYEHGAQRGADAGWAVLADLYTVVPGEWTLLTGIPSHGKSAFVDALMVNLADRHGWQFAVCSPENQPLANHAAKLARLRVGKPFAAGMSQRMNRDELSSALSWEVDHFTFVLPHENARSVGGVLAVMEAVMQRREIRGIVIDPWNELDHSRPPQLTETEWISKCLSQIRQFARRTQVHVWLVAHPAKLLKDPKTGLYPVPRPYDVSGSAHWYNKADNCLSVYRDDAAGVVQVHVQKVRFDQNGTQGVAEFTYDRLTGRYRDHYSGEAAA